MPKTTDATLLATVAGNFVAWDLFTFALSTGTVRYTSGPTSFSFGGNTWTPISIERGDLEEPEGVEIATLEVTVHLAPWALLAINGDLDNVEVTVQRAYVPNWATAPTMLSEVFAGAVCDVEPVPAGAKVTAKSHLYLGESEVPSRMAGPPCPWKFGGTECGVTLATWTSTATTTTGSTTTVVKLTTAPGANAIPGSVIKFTSGALNGLRRTVKSVSGNDLTLTRPLPSAPANGVTLDIVKGDPHTLASCGGFSALARYGGFPHLPRRD